jgi:hypothetical protein
VCIFAFVYLYYIGTHICPILARQMKKIPNAVRYARTLQLPAPLPPCSPPLPYVGVSPVWELGSAALPPPVPRGIY